MLPIVFLKVFGGYSDRATPDPIPNSEVKPVCADGTARETVWESRSLPRLFCRPSQKCEGFFFDWFSPFCSLKMSTRQDYSVVFGSLLAGCTSTYRKSFA
jgi:hypothetical protein